jgi:hypothetical protein
VRAFSPCEREKPGAQNGRDTQDEIDAEYVGANSRPKVVKRGDEARQANQDDYEPASKDILDLGVGGPDDRAERFDIRYRRRAERHVGPQ